MESLSVDVLKPTELPAPPEGAIRVVHACAQEEVDAEDIGGIVSRDPALVAELLRVANSAYFGFASEVSSVTRAVTVIGQRALRNMVLCIAMRNALRPEQLPAFPVDAFWESALRRAVCARCLGAAVQLDEDDCFTVGLLQDFGLLVMFFLNHNRVSEWARLAEAAPDTRYELEMQLFEVTHDKVGLQLAGAWELPQELAVAMGFHHETPPDGASEATQQLCKVAECADWMAAVFTAQDKRHAIQECHRLVQERFGLTPEQVDALLDEVATAMAAAAQALGFDVGEQVAFDTVLREANLRLVEENLSFQEMNWHLEHALEERDRIATELNKELELAREVQSSLLPRDFEQGLGVVGLNVSAKAVSGDFYDFYRLHTGQIAFCIADVSGKGMNAALLMAKTSSLFRCLGKGIHDPSKLLSMLNREIVETSVRGMFVTMTAGIFDPASGRVRMANAGHLPAVQMDGRFMSREYGSGGPPLGIALEVEFPAEEFMLGDHSLYLYTDGLLEAKVAEDRRLERDGLLNLLAKFSDTPPVDRLQQIVATVRRGPAGLDDDLTMLLIEGSMRGG